MTNRNDKKKEKKVKMIEVETELEDEELILGKSREVYKITIINYENPEVLYKVTNLKLKNNPMFISGQFIESFIGSNNIEARRLLKRGEKIVVTKDADGEDYYRIEVID